MRLTSHKIITRLLLTLPIAALVLVFGISQNCCNDVWAHALHGRIILEKERFPNFSDYSFVTNHDVAMKTDWLPSLLFYILLQLWGYPGLVAYTTACLAMVSVFALFWMREEGVPWGVAACLLGCIMVIGRSRFMPRADLMNIVFFTIYLYFLARHRRDGTKSLLALPFLQILWIQFHYLACLGIFLILLYTLDGILQRGYARITHRDKAGIFSPRERYLSAIAALCALTSLLNEASYHKLLQPFRSLWMSQTDHKMLYGTIAEYQPIFLFAGDSAPLWMLLRFVIPGAIVLLLLVLGWRKVSLLHLAIFAGVALVTLRYRRFLGIYAVVATVVMAIYLWNFLKERNFAKSPRFALLSCICAFVVNTTLVVLVAGNWYFRSEGWTLERCSPTLPPLDKPIRAVAFLKEHRISGNIFAEYGWGGFVGYHLYPDSKIFIHSLSFWYSIQHYKNYYFIVDPEMLAKTYGVDIFLYHHEGANRLDPVRQLYNSPHWKLVYLDEISVVLARSQLIAGEKKSLEVDLAKVSVENMPGLSPYGYYWLGEFFRHLETFGNTYRPRLYDAQAEAFYREALRAGIETAPIYNCLGGIYYARGQYLESLECFVAAAKMSPNKTFIDNISMTLERLPDSERDSGICREAEILRRAYLDKP